MITDLAERRGEQEQPPSSEVANVTTPADGVAIVITPDDFSRHQGNMRLILQVLRSHVTIEEERVRTVVTALDLWRCNMQFASIEALFQSFGCDINTAVPWLGSHPSVLEFTTQLQAAKHGQTARSGL